MRKTLSCLAASASIACMSLQAPAATTTYISALDELNNSGVSGLATLIFDDTAHTLDVTIHATGLVPDQVHPQHIHGILEGGNALCPTIAADTNGDGFVSVLEGAVDYGPIKINLTSPQTPFGPNPSPLFAPFAGVANNANFPTAPGGVIDFHQLYTFDLSNPDAAAAYAAIQPLTNQHIVLHGAFAPESVDTPGGDPATIVYDALLPVACGEIELAPVPEPATLAVLSSGLAVLAFRRRRGESVS